MPVLACVSTATRRSNTPISSTGTRRPVLPRQDGRVGSLINAVMASAQTFEINQIIHQNQGRITDDIYRISFHTQGFLNFIQSCHSAFPHYSKIYTSKYTHTLSK